MKLDINNLRELLYIFAPFIIVCYFILLSIINTDMKGIVYLIGLISSTMLTIFIGNGIVGKPTSTDKDVLCDIVTINHIAGISNIPISLTIYCFTLSYLLYTIISINITFILSSVVPIFALSVLIIMDIIWLTTKKCFQQTHIMTAGIISLLLGIGWGFIINKINNKSLQYFTTDGSITECPMPKRSYFKVSNARNTKEIQDS
jgi:hypothetical protein